MSEAHIVLSVVIEAVSGREEEVAALLSALVTHAS